jgi:thiol:disulfide interchange protein DsbC
MPRITFSTYLLAAIVSVATSAAIRAEEAVKPVAKNDDLRVQLAKKIPGAKPEDVHPTQIAGLYEISMGASTAYISADGKYLISGDLYEIDSKTNLSDVRRAAYRSQAIAAIKESDTIVFEPSTKPKHTITVFIDVDCGYCRKLHSEMAQLNKLGIRVRYTAYPRSGPGTSSWAKMETVWCSKDRRLALARAQQDQDIGNAKCGATPVAGQFKLGEDLGVNGTPAIFTENGDYIGGYLPPQKLAEYLDELKSQTAASKKAGS